MGTAFDQDAAPCGGCDRGQIGNRRGDNQGARAGDNQQGNRATHGIIARKIEDQPPGKSNEDRRHNDDDGISGTDPVDQALGSGGVVSCMCHHIDDLG